MTTKKTEWASCLSHTCIMFLIPIFVMTLHFSVRNNNEHNSNYLGNFLQQTYFDVNSVLFFTGLNAFVAILSIIRFGGSKILGPPNKNGKQEYYLINGNFCLVVCVITGMIMDRAYNISAWILEHRFQLLMGSILNGVVLTMYAHISSFCGDNVELNPNAIERDIMTQLFLGRQIRPKLFFGLLDLKLYVNRFTLVSNILCLAMVLGHNFKSGHFEDFSKDEALTLSLFIFFHLIYWLDGLIMEYTWVTSGLLQFDGFGFDCCVGHFIYPFMMLPAELHMIENKTQLSHVQMLAILAMFVVGYVFFRGGNNQKDAFRKNAKNPAFAGFDTISTERGTQLLCSGFWGILRHPNYFGDFLMTCAMMLPLGVFKVEAVPYLALLAFLIFRNYKDNASCERKYGKDWEKYCRRVKYQMFPFLY